MLLREEREKVAIYGRKMVKAKLTTGTGGNLSVYNQDHRLIAIKPSGIPYDEINVKDVVVMDLEGNIIDGNKKPSSEYRMHLIFYNNRKDIGAVVHTHSTYATTVACLNEELPPVHYMVAVAGDKVPCAEYATYGTAKLAENAYNSIRDKYKATLLANHGLLAIGKNIEEAFNIAEEIEFVAEIYYRTRAIGEPVILSGKEMELMKEKFKSYGQ